MFLLGNMKTSFPFRLVFVLTERAWIPESLDPSPPVSMREPTDLLRSSGSLIGYLCDTYNVYCSITWWNVLVSIGRQNITTRSAGNCWQPALAVSSFSALKIRTISRMTWQLQTAWSTCSTCSADLSLISYKTYAAFNLDRIICVLI